MRTINFVLIILIFVGILLSAGCIQNKQEQTTEKNNTIRVSGAFALYPLMLTWTEKYQKIRPDLKIEVSAGGAGKGMTDVLTGQADIAMVSRDLNPAEEEQGALGIAVAKDAVVATANAKNHHLSYLQTHGVNRTVLQKIFVNQTITKWNELVPSDETKGINVYTRSDSCGAAEVFAKYLGVKQENLKGTGVSADPGIAEAVAKDPNGIGYNNINYAYDPTTSAPITGLAIIPLDLNDDGMVSPDESFYQTREDLLRAIASGAYPSPPARDLYLVVKDKFSGDSKEFLEWIIHDGQQYAPPSGYIPLTETAVKTMTEKISSHL